MAVGRISGPLLKANLLRDGVPLAFETDLLYLDVVNGRIGVKTTAPTDDLHIAGTARTTDLLVDTQATLATFTISGSTISSSSSTINIEPTGASPVVYQAKIQVDDLTISGNTIESLDDITIRTNGSGVVNIQSNVEVDGNIHATGNITADGDITFGAGTQTQGAGDDTVTFVAEVASDIIPDVHNTYQLGTVEKKWADVYTENLFANAITTGDIIVDGINLILPQGNIIYVSVNGDDGNSGTHEQDPYLTVKYALSQAVSGDTIYIYPGVYTEIFPMTIPVGVTVRGSSMRSVKIIPTSGTRDKNAFLLNGESTVEDITIANFEYNAIDDTGYAFRFAANMLVTTRSPYIRNVTVITFGSTVRLATAPADDPRGYLAGDAGRGAFADGSVVNASSKEATMLFHAVTFITPAAETLKLTNGVRIEWLNSFSYFGSKGIYAYSSSAGFAGAGKTRLRINTRTGTWAVGNTVSYYDTDGTTLLASGTIASIEGNFVNLTGRCIGFETITDRIPTTIYAQGNAKLSTAQKKFGTASLILDGVGDYISHASAPDFAFGTGDFCLEAWIYRTTDSGTSQILFDFRTTTSQIVPNIFLSATYVPGYLVNGSQVITGSSPIALNTWTHIAVSRSGTSTKLFVNGTQSGSTYTDTNNYIECPLAIGSRFDGTLGFYGYIDEVRISNGTPRYTTTFTAPIAALTGDLDTVLLLHFNGNNNSTTFLDDGVTRQDLRTSAGGTASIINFADYSDFGAEVRSIGSACVYGEYGVYADGPGVILYLISENFGYVGAGRFSTNDPNDRIAANEVVELNGAKVYYTSVDNEGNFKVGDNFFINQKTGEVNFNNQSLTVTTTDGFIFDNGVTSTTVTAEGIDTGNLRISGNTIESLTGEVNVTAANGQINLQNNTSITGDLDVTGTVTIGGNITIGDQSSDTISFVAGINSNLVPATTGLYDLGTSSLRWQNLYLSGNFNTTGNMTVTGNISSTGYLQLSDVRISGHTIETTTTNTDLTLLANGTGNVFLEGFKVDANNLQSVATNSNITLTPQGTGSVVINNNTSLKIPVGTDADRPASPTNGMIRYNTTRSQYEGWNGTYWLKLSGVQDIAGTTYIKAEATPGANDNTLYFYANSLLTATLTETALTVPRFQTTSLDISDNTITTLSANQDINFLTLGTGGVRLGNFKFRNNTIQNTVSGAVSEITQTGTGYVKFAGANGVVIPAGNSTTDRPSNPVIGMVRFNSEFQLVEVYNGVVWTSVAGTSSGVSFNDATDIGIAMALSLG